MGLFITHHTIKLQHGVQGYYYDKLFNISYTLQDLEAIVGARFSRIQCQGANAIVDGNSTTLGYTLSDKSILFGKIDGGNYRLF